jgi:hypothetical protein
MLQTNKEESQPEFPYSFCDPMPYMEAFWKCCCLPSVKNELEARFE